MTCSLLFSFPSVQLPHHFLTIFCPICIIAFSNPLFCLLISFPIPHLCSLLCSILLYFISAFLFHIIFSSLLSLHLYVLPISSPPCWQQCRAFQVQSFAIPLVYSSPLCWCTLQSFSKSQDIMSHNSHCFTLSPRTHSQYSTSQTVFLTWFFSEA